MLLPLTPADFESYLAALRWLVHTPSPFTEPAAVTALMGEVRKRMQRLLPSYICTVDVAGNLTCVPPAIDAARPLLYLSAHVDTVPSEPSLWTAPFAPHPAYEDATQLVAQGVNDCKAGVATQLWLAHLASTGAIALNNVIFTFTFKEEGAGPKTGVTLGQAFGHALPAPTTGSTLLVLENTVRSDAPYVPLCYTAESSSYTIRLTGTLTQLRAPGEKFYLGYFGSAWPPHYGVRPDAFLPTPTYLVRPPLVPYDYAPGLYAISATVLSEVYTPYRGPWTPALEQRWQTLRAAPTPETYPEYDRLRFARLCKILQLRAPLATPGYSILVYRLTPADLRAALEGPVTGAYRLRPR
jgi:hypothetical protein